VGGTHSESSDEVHNYQVKVKVIRAKKREMLYRYPLPLWQT